MKAQIATEYLVVVGIVVLIIIPLTYVYIKYSNQSEYAITSAKVSSIANEISKIANSAYVYGQDTQLTIDLDFPSNIQSITFSNKDIIFKIKNSQGDVVDIVKQAEVSLTSLSSGIPVTQGRKKIVVKSLGDKVLVQIPCKNEETKCISRNEAGCKAESCSLICASNSWKISQVCDASGCEDCTDVP